MGEQQVSLADHVRARIAMARPMVLFTMALFAAVGLAASGAYDRPAAVVLVMLVVTGYLLYSVLVNDLADEVIDRVNLAGMPGRPLVEGRADRAELVVTAAAAAAVALGGALALGGAAPAIVAGGLVVSTAYSLPSVRLAGRGAIASLVLPGPFVAIPFLLGLVAGDAPLTRSNGLLLAGLYIGFIGRILLKDFRDLRGDALFGKRTFLVRHGRAATCRFSAVCWTVGSILLSVAPGATPVLAASDLVLVAVALALLRALRSDGGARRDEILISAIALTGRGLVTLQVAHLCMVDAAWPSPATAAMTIALTALVLGKTREMLRHGPRTRSGVPDWLMASSALRESDSRVMETT
jgi:4-hydroxybenzoate polyprenyltransferase